MNLAYEDNLLFLMQRTCPSTHNLSQIITVDRRTEAKNKLFDFVTGLNICF